MSKNWIIIRFPASNEWKIILFMKNRHLPNWIIWLPWLSEHLSQDMLHMLVVFYLVWHSLENIYIRSQQHKNLCQGNILRLKNVMPGGPAESYLLAGQIKHCTRQSCQAVSLNINGH